MPVPRPQPSRAALRLALRSVHRSLETILGIPRIPRRVRAQIEQIMEEIAPMLRRNRRVR
jgi:hypothetical protein